ncbi:MAG: Hsp70 family protein [Spirochaetia bacterium]
MNDSVIAIRTADGALVPVLETGTRNRKQLVVTTARNDQKRVHIDMYEGPADNLANSEYIGSLVIDRIDPAAAGETEIRFVAGLDERGQLKATATNLANGDSQSLSISLTEGERGPDREGDADDLGDLPDFSMDDEVVEDLESLEGADSAGESSDTVDDDLESLAGADSSDDDLESLSGADSADEDLESLSGAEASDAVGSSRDSDSSEVPDLSEQFDEPPLFDEDFDIEEQPEESSFRDTDFQDDELEELSLDGDEQDDNRAGEETLSDEDFAGATYPEGEMPGEGQMPGDEAMSGFEIETQAEEGRHDEPGTGDGIETGGGFETERDFDTGGDLEPDFAEEDFDFPEPETDEVAESGESALDDEDFALPEPESSEEGVFQSQSAAPRSVQATEDEWRQESAGDTGESAVVSPSFAFYIAYMLLALGILAGLIYLIYGALQGEPVPPLESGRPLIALFLPALIAHRRIASRSAMRCGRGGAGLRNTRRYP